MEDVELAIKIPQAYYELVLERCKDPVLLNAFKNGILIPRGHGRLGDLDKLEKDMENGIMAGMLEEGYERYTRIFSLDDCVERVQWADTIIEADKEE